MSDSTTSEHTSWLESFFGGGGSDPAPQAPAPTNQNPAGGGLSYSGPNGFGFSMGSDGGAPAAAATQQTAPAAPNCGPSAFGTDETAGGTTPDEAFGGTPAGASAPEKVGSAPSLWDKTVAAAIADPVLGVPRVLGGAFADYVSEAKQKEEAEEREKAEGRARREAQRQLDAQGNTKEKADAEDQRRQAAEDDYYRRQDEKTAQIMREKREEAEAEAEYQKQKASKDPATQEYLNNEDRKRQQPTR